MDVHELTGGDVLSIVDAEGLNEASLASRQVHGRAASCELALIVCLEELDAHVSLYNHSHVVRCKCKYLVSKDLVQQLSLKAQFCALFNAVRTASKDGSCSPGWAWGGSAEPASQVSRKTSTLPGWSAAGRLDTAGEARILNPAGVPSGCTKNLSLCNGA